MPEHHKVPIIKIDQVLIHPNADVLELVHIGGYQVVVKKGQFKAGDLAVYVYPDSVIPTTTPFKFIWGNFMCDDGKGGFYVPEKRRRITVRKFRKAWSEGLLLPISDFPELKQVQEGDDVAKLLDVTHYDPPEPGERVERQQQYKGWPKSLRGWFYFLMRLIGLDLNGAVGGANEKGPKNPPPVYDVENLKNHLGSFVEGESVVVTEKVHGSNARFIFDGKKLYVGSRKLWKSPKSACIWRKALQQNPWIEIWCREHVGWTLFGEVVPTQGDGWKYGCKDGEVKFLVFDCLTPDGNWIKPWETGSVPTTVIVPILFSGPFSEAIKGYVDGPSEVADATNIREGIVVNPINERHIHGLGRLQLKLVSNLYLEAA